ncbi:DNA repair protein Rad9 [Novymonas esmeraldas]|uniref:DNA repair protein Rad9 n=1 Tax=Novymonas esmeraldas TaxID=1808958 RepID=A0AAW0EPV2_9TRYP
MSLHFTVSGPNIRVLLNVLTCVSRLGDAVCIVALGDGIEISAVSPSRNSHIAVRMHERCFDRFQLETPQEQHQQQPSSDADSANGPGLYVTLLSKTLVATVLRQHSSSTLQSLALHYTTAAAAADAVAGADDAAASTPHHGGADVDEDAWDARRDADVVRWHCAYARHVTKTFLLRLAEGGPIGVAADVTRYRLEVCGDARAYGGLLASLPSSASQCTLSLPESGGLELRSAQQPGSATAAAGAAGSGRDSGVAPAAPPVGSARAADGSSTVVTAFPNTFTLFRFFTAAAAAAAPAPPVTAHSDSVPSEVQPTPSSCSAAPATPHGVSAPALSATTTTGYVSLPSKTFDVKPLKNATWLAEQLGTQLRLLSGDDGVPLIFASITHEEVHQRRVAAGPARHESGLSALRPVLATSHGSAAPLACAPASVSFTLHVAALDSTPGDSGGSTRASGSVGAVDVNIAAALSSATAAADSPRHSTHNRGSRGAPPVATTTAAISPTASVLAAATHSSMQGSQAEVELGSGRQRGTPDARHASGTPTHPRAEEEEEDVGVGATAERSGGHTPSHVPASFTSASGGDLSARRLSSHTAHSSAIGSADTTPRPSASPATTVVMVMTGGDTPRTRVAADSAGADGATAAAAAVPSAALDSMYPLDYEALMRTYTSSTSAGEHGDADGAEDTEDAEDAELREFLLSCATSMGRGPALS